MLILKTLCLASAAVVLSGAASRAAPLKAVVFDLELVSSSLDGLDDPQTERVKKMSAELRELLAKSGQVELVDTAPEAAAIAKNSPLRNCHDCDLDIAKVLGADIEVTTAVQKSSDVILSFSGSIRDVKTGKVLSTGQVAVRGNTDDMWNHGIKYLVKERLLDPPLPKSPEALRAALDK